MEGIKILFNSFQYNWSSELLWKILKNLKIWDISGTVRLAKENFQ